MTDMLVLKSEDLDEIANKCQLLFDDADSPSEELKSLSSFFDALAQAKKQLNKALNLKQQLPGVFVRANGLQFDDLEHAISVVAGFTPVRVGLSHGMKNLPNSEKVGCMRVATFLKGEYKRLTQLDPTLTNNPITSSIEGQFVNFIEAVCSRTYGFNSAQIINSYRKLRTINKKK
jgi:hypothetical protein